ncbi:hypothetical protein SHI21_11225 [Bacteriovorax sp. PP10]|uniref:Uncharacterized protein n=1 Tax=Bacteriovorax antarcticus TaxID=3088717 RepID=A0ABU5VUQ4_9BACT|nr:hypothetical protein [Bacteriovorax sp. PP10]MEA9356782.1 hypothetical protein [Bacteriovorax sp. PP10]
MHKTIFVLLFILANPAWAAKSKLDQAVLNEYLKAQKEYSDISCTPGVESSYKELDTKYRGDGNFIPVLLDQKVDQKTIKATLPLIKEKIIWIKSQESNVSKVESFEEVSQTLKRIENEVAVLQEAKKDMFLAKTKEQKKDIEERAQKQFIQLMKEVENLKNQAPYLLSFKFPLNHLVLRADYEKFKGVATKEARSKANAIYLSRRVLQDGSYDENLVRNDSVIRAGFDTLYLSLTKDKDRSLLTDNERSDFKFVLTNFQNLLDLGKETLSKRYVEWADRAERSLAFYQDLADGKKIKVNDTATATDIAAVLEERARSLYNLKAFVLKKEAASYEYWSKKSELFQYLFALETILYAEVGRIDAPDALERRDVAQVVINRFSNDFYSNMGAEDSLNEYLAKDLKTKDYKWLNVLFKEGEFSFTYFYIPGNLHIYCPDMSKVGQFLRRENVRIALALLNKPRKDFPAMRYFSRVSMFGRIEMDSLWDNYKAVGEVPGRPVKNKKMLGDLYKQDRYKFLYDFETDDKKKTYIVVEMKGKPYVVDFNKPTQVYYYRNPNQFRYFAPLK